MSGLVIDNFAGGGGASLGIERALGVRIDVAVNHDPEAVAIHRANHPATEHLCQNVWQVDPAEIRKRGPIDLAWFSPDCKHFSKAKGGRPVQRNIRDLAWVVVLWARRARPAVIMLENVEEFQDWGPLLEDGKPCPVQKGLTFRRWTSELRAAGYAVEWRELRACDYGAPTIRKRLFVIARRDGLPIVWPTPTHGPALLPYRTAAEIIDFTQPVHSIFLTAEEARQVGVRRPLKEATMRRIARGVFRYVIDTADPFIIPITHVGGDRVHPITEPLRTVTTARRGEFAYVAPHITKFRGGSTGSRADKPLHTITAGGDMARPAGAAHAMGFVAAFLAQHNTGMTGHDMRKPMSTIVQKGCTQALVAAHMMSFKGSTRRARSIEEPVQALCAGGFHVAEVRAFLLKYYGTAVGQDLGSPLHSVVSKARFGLVTVAGADYRIADIGMRMLMPRELFSAQGFPPDYVIDPVVNGRPLTKTAQIRMCGNSVCPDVAEALVRANVRREAAVPAAGVAD